MTSVMFDVCFGITLIVYFYKLVTLTLFFKYKKIALKTVEAVLTEKEPNRARN